MISSIFRRLEFLSLNQNLTKKSIFDSILMPQEKNENVPIFLIDKFSEALY